MLLGRVPGQSFGAIVRHDNGRYERSPPCGANATSMRTLYPIHVHEGKEKT